MREPALTPQARKRKVRAARKLQAHIIWQVLPVVKHPTGFVSLQYGGGGLHGSYWQQLVPVAHPTEAGIEQPGWERTGQLPASPMEKHASAAPPQQGITQYWSALQVFVPQVIGPVPPLLRSLPPIALPPPGLLEPPTLVLPPAPALASPAVPLHAGVTSARRPSETTRRTIWNSIMPGLQRTCPAISCCFRSIARVLCAISCANVPPDADAFAPGQTVPGGT